MAKIFLSMTSMDLSSNEMGIVRDHGFVPITCQPGYVFCLESMACVLEDEQLADDWQRACPLSEEEPPDTAVFCNTDEVYCTSRKQCVSMTDMHNDERPPIGCSKMGAAKVEDRFAMQQLVVVCAAGQVFCASERVCLEMNDYNPFTQPQAETTTGTSATMFTTESSISPVRDTTARMWTEVHTTTPLPITQPSMAATARSTVIPAIVKEQVANDYHALKETLVPPKPLCNRIATFSVNEVGDWFRLLVG